MAARLFCPGARLAQKWRPFWQAVVYMLLLGVAVRFFHYALFEEPLISPYYFIVDCIFLIAAALLGYRLKRSLADDDPISLDLRENQPVHLARAQSGWLTQGFRKC